MASAALIPEAPRGPRPEPLAATRKTTVAAYNQTLKEYL